MKLLVVMPRYHSGSKPDYHYVYPLGIGYVTAVLKRAGHHVDCVNLNHLAGPVDEILIPFLTSSPEPYDFVLTGATSVYYTQVKAVVEAVRRSGTPTKTMPPELLIVKLALVPVLGLKPGALAMALTVVEAVNGNALV